MECIECGNELGLGADIEVGELITCSDCGTDLEVTSLDPLKLELAPEEEEDWGE